MIASIVVDIAAKQVNQTFDYMVPSHLESILKVGYRVRVIFGNRTVLGFVVELKEKTAFKKKLREISDIIDVYPVLNEEFVGLAKFIANHNFSYYAVALQTMIPSALKIKYQKIARVKEIPLELEDIFKGKKEIWIDNRTPEELNRIFKAHKEGIVELDTRFKRNRKEKTIEYIYIKDDTISPKSKQGIQLLEYLKELDDATSIPMVLENTGFSKGVIDTLIKQGILDSYKKEVLEQDNILVSEIPAYELNASQKKAYDSIHYNETKTYLLHGVTGSGKTLVYIHWIKDVLASGKQALLLVPEISLTPQITAIFQSHFGNEVAILHSRLSVYDRYTAWKKILTHQVRIVIGARSAIFAPLDHLGIIIIDEEHEQSYIQDNNPKYSAIEIAKLRSKTHQCPLILGSATPNVCDYYQAIEGEYELLSMPTRANEHPLPKKTLVDMREELKLGNKSVFSKPLQKRLVEVYKKNEQSILFLNRRGHSSFVMCRSCGEVIQCPHCDVSLTYHSSTNTLVCHHCGYKQMNVENCPSCGSSKIRFVGSGTEKVMEEIKNLLPEARVLRVDLDTTSKIVDYESAFEKFKNHEADIMVGTQMIAKGLDFADVTLVGVVNADLALHYPSYASNMTAFNLIEQVSGRAGRGEKTGEVIIQTYQPEHFVLETSMRNDFDGFFKKEIANRKITGMPPFSLAIEIMIESENLSMARTEAFRMIQALKSVAKESEILGPAEALPFRLHDTYRFTIQLKIVEDAVMDKISEIYPMYQTNKDVNIKITRM
ncbi:MAG: primosomal protein N' [Roseburia sp.]|nr:primosomal protein N' [Anaeroplasma bactoclasticum]MCM1195691.1 primosomal protein N' [Roseburia sp.]MCM1556357.1 primosomal protein N' [Anaeroplasma bactoclasticum]